MKTLLGIYRLLKMVFYIVECLFIVAFILPGCDDARRGRIIRVWARKLPERIGIRVDHVGELDCPEAFDTGITPKSLGRLLVSNHVTFLDPFVIDAVLPASFVAKMEIGGWPVIGRIANAVGTIYIERERKRSLLGIAEAMQKALLQGRNVLMFPEGTTSSGLSLIKMHSNLFEPAIRTGAETIPLLIQYKQNGVPTTIPAWVGDETLFSRLWTILCSTGLSVTVHVLPSLKAEDRHELCKMTSAVLSKQLGAPDPLAD